MKLTFSTLGCVERSLEQVIALAKERQFDAVEIRGLGGEMDNSLIECFKQENAESTRRLLCDAGVHPLVLGTSVSLHDPEKYADMLMLGRESVDIAARIGFSFIRIFGNNVTDDEDGCIRRVADGIRELCRYSDGRLGILLEVHGDFNTAGRLARITELCGDMPEFGILWDLCHTRKTVGEGWREFYRQFAPFIKHVHLKDIRGEKLVLPAEGELPLTDMVRHLDKEGYGGYISLEWEKKWHPELPDIERALDAMQKIL